MDDMSPESMVIYNILKAETEEAYESKFLAHKKEILDAVKLFVNDTEKQFKDVGNNLESILTKMMADLVRVKSSLGGDLSRHSQGRAQIGRASCRERVYVLV